MEKPKAKRIRYLRLENEDADLLLPQIGIGPRKTVEISKVAYQPSLLLPKLKPEGKEFFKLVDSDKTEDVVAFLNRQKGFNVNCQNYSGATALTKAVSNGNLSMVETILAQPDIIVGDSILRAIDKGDCAIISAVLDKLTRDGKDERASCYTESPDYSPDITPIMLAAISENYEVIRLLLGRGHFVDKPHKPNCFCKEKCWARKRGETLRDSIKRLTAYKALSSPAYICQSSSDPILTAFELSKEFYAISKMEREFVEEYVKLSEDCKKFALDILNVARTTEEVSLLLKRKQGYRRRRPVKFSRLATAVDYEQREFVAHHNSQTVLRAAWLREWQDWKSLSNIEKVCRIFPRIVMLPFIAIVYWLAPKSKYAISWSSPINKFLSTTASYCTFLVLLFIHNFLDSKDHIRGPPHTGLEAVIGLFVFGFVWAEIKKIWYYGWGGYFESKWNIYTLLMLCIFLSTFVSWIWAYTDVLENDNTHLERRFWDAYDPTLIAEGLYSVATVMACGRLLLTMQVNNNLGPLEVSISRMYKDIIIFMVIFAIILFSFAAGIHKLYQYYIDQMYLNVHGIKVAMIHHFDTFPHTLYTLFWSIFAMSPVESANVILSPVGGNKTHPKLNTHDFTQAVGHMLFSIYHVVTIIILLNLLIAMMANSFQKVTDNADMEWKFARTRVWLSFFEEGGTLPPPFNIIPSPKSFIRAFYWCYLKIKDDSKAKFATDRCCYIDEEVEEDTEGDYQILMARLVQRYLRTKEKEKESQSPTTADLDRIETELKEIKFALLGNQESRPPSAMEGE